MNKNSIDRRWDCNIDQQAEKEAKALNKQGYNKRDKRIRLRDDYNTVKFDKLFKD